MCGSFKSSKVPRKELHAVKIENFKSACLLLFLLRKNKKKTQDCF